MSRRRMNGRRIGNRDERQTVQYSTNGMGSGASSGSYRLVFAGQSTSLIPYNASGNDVTAALEALSNIGAGNVVAVGGGSSLTITFQGDLAATNVPQLTVSDNTITNPEAESFSFTIATERQGAPNTFS